MQFNCRLVKNKLGILKFLTKLYLHYEKATQKNQLKPWQSDNLKALTHKYPEFCDNKLYSN